VSSFIASSSLRSPSTTSSDAQHTRKILTDRTRCILQDSQEDWQHEAALMSSVFSNSLITLAATDSPNSYGGLYLDDFVPPYRVQCKTSGSWSMVRLAAKASNIVASPLNSRAWVLQEMVLSRRTVHFTKGQFYWQCYSASKSEDGAVDTEKFDTLIGEDSPPFKSFDLSEPVALRQYWWIWVGNYSNRQLSYSNDKLAAFAGIIHFYAEQTQLTPALGLWTERLAFDLGWRVYKRDRGLESDQPGFTNIPSWSWLAPERSDIHSPFYDLFDRDFRPRISVMKCESVWAGEPFCSPLSYATLVISGYMKTFSPTWQTQVYFDQNNKFDAHGMSCLILASGFDHRHLLSFLVLEQAGYKDGLPTYRRIGVGTVDADNLEPFDVSEMNVISLV
jgi:hypothetical protein